MKKVMEYIIFIGILLLIYFYRVNITIYAVKLYNYYSGRELKVNEYSKNTDYLGYQTTDDVVPNNKQELINIIYTLLDDGVSDYMFYCGYDECIDDLNDIANNGILQAINNYVHPYNSFSLFNYNIIMDVVSVSIEKNYDEMEIASINAKLDYLLPSIIHNGMNDYNKIKVFHDYIVNNTKYEYDDENILSKDNHKAYNVLINGKGVCSGYADILDIFLYRMGYKAIKVANEEHIWNVVFLNDQIYNIDMTWDDPLVNGGGDTLIHDYFMVSNSELQRLDKNNKHYFNSNLYMELK